MNKVDFIKLRVTPEFKARVQREAAYRQIGVSKLIIDALEAEMSILVSRPWGSSAPTNPPLTPDSILAPEVPVTTPEESVPTAADAAWKKDDYAPWRQQ